MPPPIPLAASASPGEIAIVVGYPARDPDVPDQELVRQVFGDVYDKKRLAPGEILKVTDSEIEHDCSTLGGNSGSAVISLATGEALGLHFAGLYMEANYAVPAPKLRDLLNKLQSRSLPGMRAIEVSSPATPIPAVPTTTTMQPAGGGRTFTLEAYVPIKVTLEFWRGVDGPAGCGAPRKPSSVGDNRWFLLRPPCEPPGISCEASPAFSISGWDIAFGAAGSRTNASSLSKSRKSKAFQSCGRQASNSCRPKSSGSA